MTFTEKWSTETLQHAVSRDAEICICNVQSGFPRAEARSYHSEDDHLLSSLCVRYGWIIYCPCLMQLSSILPPWNGHQEVTYQNWWLWQYQARNSTPMRKVKTRAMWWSTLLNLTPPKSDDAQSLDSTLQSDNQTELHILSEIAIKIPNQQSIPFPSWRSKLHTYQATMAIDNRNDDEVVNWALNFARVR